MMAPSYLEVRPVRDYRLRMFLFSIPALLFSTALVQGQSSNYGINTSHPYCAKPLPAIYDEKEVVAKSLALVKNNLLSNLSPDNGDGVTILGALYKSDLDLRWPTRRVPYFFDPSVVAKPKLAVAVRAAAKHINERTLIRLTEVSAADLAKEKNGYIRVVDSIVKVKGMSRDCAAFPVGYPKSTDKYLSTLWVGGGKDDYCNDTRAGSIVHEFLHALGMKHEQMHHYRDAYIKIYPDNLKNEDAKFQWGVTADEIKMIKNSEDAGVAYDFSSIMHYHDVAFVKDGLKAFTVVDPEGKKALKEITDKEIDFEIGQQDCMSQLDASTINILYESPDRGKEK